jgi:AcrR family transcriptional regulator
MPEKTDRREAILEAMLDLIVERGLHNAPMSVLAKRSGASPGVIYHYFPSKDELIRALYLHVKSTKLRNLRDGYDSGMSPQETFVHAWIKTYHFYRNHLRETRFLDQYENSPICNSCSAATKEEDEDKFILEFKRHFRSRKEGGVLNDLPPEVVKELSFGAALRLAKAPRQLSSMVLKSVASKIWIAITS